MILSIDASTHSTGWAAFDDKTSKLIDYGCITATYTNNIKRIFHMVKELKQIIKKYKIDIIVLEEVLPKSDAYDDKSQHHQNPTVFKPLMWLQGAINFMIYKNFSKIKIEYLMPNSWRSLCGIRTGAGHKREELKQKDMQFVQEKFKINVNDDIADACCLGWAYIKSKNLDGFLWE